MDKLTNYRNIIKRILSDHVKPSEESPKSEIEDFMIADEMRDHYLLFNLGWWERKRVRNFTVYVRIVNGKFHIEHDLTEAGIATELIEAGVPEQDIVLAFHAPELRQYTEFAAA
ncbi:MAG TPA: XisI protein [Blastocatellia bacterium]|nr:XisI protein [Blastocatellia bacterium]HNG32418.1 XisI protein [Blastocatellia bacterium]